MVFESFIVGSYLDHQEFVKKEFNDNKKLVIRSQTIDNTFNLIMIIFQTLNV